MIIVDSLNTTTPKCQCLQCALHNYLFIYYGMLGLCMVNAFAILYDAQNYAAQA